MANAGERHFRHGHYTAGSESLLACGLRALDERPAVIFGPVRAKIIEQEKWIVELRRAEPDRAMKMHTGALGGRLAPGHFFDGSKFAHWIPLHWFLEPGKERRRRTRAGWYPSLLLWVVSKVFRRSSS